MKPRPALATTSTLLCLALGVAGCGSSDHEATPPPTTSTTVTAPTTAPTTDATTDPATPAAETTSAAPTTAAPDPSKTLFPDDFEGVCQGASQSNAAAYAKGPGLHKALYFETFTDNLLDQSSQLPKDWTVEFSPSGNALSAVQLVGCATRTKDAFVKKCTGYTVKGKATANTVELYNATYELSLHVAATGATLGTTTVAAADSTCPSFVSFTEGEDTKKQYASVPEAKVNAFLKPFVQP